MIEALFESIRRFAAHRSTAHAAEMALSGLLALFPLLILLGWLVEWTGRPGLAGYVERLLFIVWPRSIAQPMVIEANAVRQSLTGAGIVPAMFFAPLLVANALEALRSGLDNAYGQDDRMPFLRARLQSLTLAIVTIALLLGLAWSLSLIVELPELDAARTPVLPGSGPILLVPFSGLVLVTAGLFVFHGILPARGRGPRRALPGIVLTGLVWAAATYGFAFYAERIAGFQATYGGYASALLTLVLFFITAASVLLGAELNAVRESNAHRL